MSDSEPMNLCDPMLDPYNQAKQLRLQVAELDDELMQLRHARDELLQAGNKLAAMLTDITDSDAVLAEWDGLNRVYGYNG